MASWVDTLEMPNRWLSRPTSDTAMPSASSAVTSGSSEAEQRPAEHDQQHGQRGRDADAERPAQADPLGVADGRAAQRDVHVGAVGGLGCADQASWRRPW